MSLKNGSTPRAFLILLFSSFLPLSNPTSANAADPCAVALIPHPREEPTDREIARLQERIQKAQDPVPYLERLGWAYVTKARLTFDPGYYKLAEQCALCIESRKPESAAALLLRGHVKHNLHQFKEAEALARVLVERRGVWFDYALLGDALMEQGRLSEAALAYQEMMDQRPGPQAYKRAAHIRWLKGDLAGAITLMRMAATGSQDSEALAWANVRLAAYLSQAGHAPLGEQLLDTTLDLKPGYAPALLLRGRLLLAAADFRGAVTALSRAADLNPLPEYLWTLAEAHRAAGEIKEAAEVEAQLLERGAVDDPRTFALYLLATGRSVDVPLRLTQTELESRADVFTLDARAWALRAAGKLDEARVMIRRAMETGTQDARLFFHAGVIAAESGRSGEAEKWLAKAIALEPMLLPSEKEVLWAFWKTSPTKAAETRKEA